MKKHIGAILPIVLIFLFVFTLLVTSSSQEVILQIKSEAATELNQAVFERAESGIIQSEMSLLNINFLLPSSTIALNTVVQLEKTDPKGNKTYRIQSTACAQHQQVELNVVDIFATVPVLSYHRISWQIK